MWGRVEALVKVVMVMSGEGLKKWGEVVDDVELERDEVVVVKVVMMMGGGGLRRW